MSEPGRKITPDQEQLLAEYLAHTLLTEELQSSERQLLEDDDLAEDLYSDVNLALSLKQARQSYPPVPDEKGPRPRGWVRMSLRYALPVAASLLVVFLIAEFRHKEIPPAETTLRGPAIALKAVAPVGEIDRPPQRFVWTKDPAAASYRFSIYDEEIHLLYQAATPDTFIVIPRDAVDWQAVRKGVWEVIPLNASGVKEPGSTLTGFEIAPGE